MGDAHAVWATEGLGLGLVDSADPAGSQAVDDELVVAREAQHRTGLAIGNLVRQLRPLRSATIAINGTRQTFNPEITPPINRSWTR